MTTPFGPQIKGKLLKVSKVETHTRRLPPPREKELSVLCESTTNTLHVLEVRKETPIKLFYRGPTPDASIGHDLVIDTLFNPLKSEETWAWRMYDATLEREYISTMPLLPE
jgi:hypothetical protein